MWCCCLAPASGARHLPLFLLLSSKPPLPLLGLSPPHGFGVLHGVVPKCRSGPVVFLRFRGFLRLRREEQLAPRLSRRGCDLGPRRIGDCLLPGSRFLLCRARVKWGPKMRPLALVALLVASVLGSRGEGSSTHCHISFSFPPLLWFLGAVLCAAQLARGVAPRGLPGCWGFLRTFSFFQPHLNNSEELTPGFDLSW